MDIAKLIDLVTRLDVPGLVADLADMIGTVTAAASRAPHILTEADRAELDTIHADALAAADALDAKLATAERR